MTGKHDVSPLSSYRSMNLIATYEELFRVPESERITYYFGGYSGYFLKYGTSEDTALSAYSKALAAIQMDSDVFLQSDDFIYRSGIIARIWNCMLGENASLEKALNCWQENLETVLIHKDAPDCRIPLENFSRLTGLEQRAFSALLEAKVANIRASDCAIEVEISGVAPEELMRFNEACDAFMEAEKSIGPVMG
ncbi:hypothetical protein AALA80_05085 [Oscillospiraceae bacterium 50-60]